MKVRPERTQVKYISDAPLWVWLLALPTNIGLGKKPCQLSLLQTFVNHGRKKIITLGPGCLLISKSDKQTLGLGQQGYLEQGTL
jgi:hypothetical protein